MRPEESGRATAASGGGAPDTTESWLALFEGLLHLPPKEKESIRAEIGSHLKERVRDLLLEGYNETNAIHAATRELGDAAELAKKFESVARGRTRRTIMHTSIIGLGIGALVTAGVFTFQHERTPVASSSYQAPPPVEPPAEARDATVTLTLDSSLSTLFDAIRERTDLKLLIDWGSLQACNVSPDEPLGLVGEEIPLLRVLELARSSQTYFDWRFRPGGVLEIGVPEQFADEDTTLVAYDVEALLLELREEYNVDVDTVQEAVRDLLMTFVETEQWIDMGGSKGKLQIVGGTMFIEATASMHEKIGWILQELQEKDEVGGMLKLEPAVDNDELAGRVPSHLSIGDAVAIEIHELMRPGEWFTTTRLVEDNGAVRLPVIGDVHAEGKSVGEVEELIRATLQEKGYIGNPLVSVYTPVATRAAALPPQVEFMLAKEMELRHLLMEIDERVRQLAAELPVHQLEDLAEHQLAQEFTSLNEAVVSTQHELVQIRVAPPEDTTRIERAQFLQTQLQELLTRQAEVEQELNALAGQISDYQALLDRQSVVIEELRGVREMMVDLLRQLASASPQ